MVSIRKAKQGFQLRKRGAYGGFLSNASPAEREKVGLVVGGLCVGFLIVVLFQLGVFGDSSSGNLSQQGKLETLRRTKKHPVLMEEVSSNEDVQAAVAGGTDKASQQRKRMDDRYNAAALELIEFLDCPKLLEEAVKSIKEYNSGGFGGSDEDPENGGFDKINNGQDDPTHRRRLEEEAQQHGDDGGFGDENKGGAADPDGTKDDDQAPEDKWGEDAAGAAGGGDPNGDDKPRLDDEMPRSGDGYGAGGLVNAKHLFCLAASENPPPEVQNQLKCDAAGRKRRTLLDLWTDARAQIQDPSLLTKVLGLAQEHSDRRLLGRSYHIWAPENDEGLEFMLNSLNSEQVCIAWGVTCRFVFVSCFVFVDRVIIMKELTPMNLVNTPT